MYTNKKLILILVACTIGFFASCQDKSEDLLINVIGEPVSSSITVEYYNNSQDTLILPVSTLKIHGVQNFSFSSSTIQYSGNDVQLTLPGKIKTRDGKEDDLKRTCLISYSETDKYAFIPPKTGIKRVYNLIDLGYSGFKIGEKYDFFISLNIDDSYKELCPKIWTGTKKSDNYTLLDR